MEYSGDGDPQHVPFVVVIVAAPIALAIAVALCSGLLTCCCCCCLCRKSSVRNSSPTEYSNTLLRYHDYGVRNPGFDELQEGARNAPSTNERDEAERCTCIGVEPPTGQELDSSHPLVVRSKPHTQDTLPSNTIYSNRAAVSGINSSTFIGSRFFGDFRAELSFSTHHEPPSSRHHMQETQV